MANTATALIGESWSANTQDILHKSLVAMEICNTEIVREMTVGDTINKPYYSTTASAVTYTPGSSITIQDFAATNEALQADQKKVVPFYVDDVNELFFDYPAQTELSSEAAYTLRDAIDQDVLGEHSNATQDLDDGDLGGTAGSAITASSANIVSIFSQSRKLLRDKNVSEEGDFFAVVSTSTAEIMERTAADKGFKVADSTLRNGFVGGFLGFNVYVSNNLTSGSYGTDTVDHHLFGKKGAISLAIKQSPTVQIKEVSDQLGANILTYTVWGVKTFNTGADRLIDGNIVQ